MLECLQWIDKVRDALVIEHVPEYNECNQHFKGNLAVIRIDEDIMSMHPNFAAQGATTTPEIVEIALEKIQSIIGKGRILTTTPDIVYLISVHAPATAAQVAYCRKLFRRAKFHYRCLTDDKLAEAVLKNTQFDLNNLDHGEANEIITCLNGKQFGW